MTYQERQQYRDLRERIDALGERLGEGDADAPITRREGRELLELINAAVERMSPERWDRALDAVAEEAARRSGSPTGMYRE